MYKTIRRWLVGHSYYYSYNIYETSWLNRMLIIALLQKEEVLNIEILLLYTHSVNSALSIFITHDVFFHCFHYGIRVYTMWVPRLRLCLLHAGYKESCKFYRDYMWHDQEEWVGCRRCCFSDIGKNRVKIPLFYIVFSIVKSFITL